MRPVLVVPLALAGLAAFAATRAPVSDSDFFWHLAIGRDIAAHGGTLWHVRVGRSGEGRGIRISQHLIDLIGQEDGSLRVRVRRYRSGRAYEFDEVALAGIEPIYDLSGLEPAEVDDLLERIALAFVVTALGITTA